MAVISQLTRPFSVGAFQPGDGSLCLALPDNFMLFRGMTIAASWRRALILGASGILLIMAVGLLTAPAPSPEPITVALRMPAGVGADAPAARMAYNAAWVTLASMEQVYPVVGEEVDTVAVSRLPGAAGADVTVFFIATERDVRMITRRSVLSIPLFLSTELVSDAVAGELRGVFDRPARGVDTSTEAFRRYTAVIKRYQEGELGPALLDELQEVRRLARKWPPPYATEASIAAYLYNTTGDRHYLRRAQRLIRIASQLSASPAVLSASVEVAIAMRDVTLARNALTTLQQQHGKHRHLAMLEALVLELEGKRDEGIKRLAMISEPSPVELQGLGQLEYRAGNLREALTHFKAAHEKSGSLANAAVQAGIELVYGDPRVAEDLYTQLMSEAVSPGLLCDLGTALLLQGRTAEAIDYYERASAAGMRSPVLDANRGDAEILRGNRAAALGHYERAASGWPDVPGLTGEELAQYAYSLVRLGDHEGAKAKIDQALELAPESPTVAFCAWLITDALGEEEEAQSHKQRAAAYGLSPWWLLLPLTS